jgi:hypothetical protein
MTLNELVKDIKRNRKGIGEVKRICTCGQIFPMNEDGTNTWDKCLSCRRGQNES